MHMLSKNDSNSAELETVQVSKNPVTVITANEEVQTNEKATVYVKELDLSVLRRVFQNSAKHTDIPMSGPVVNYQISSKMAEGYFRVLESFSVRMSVALRLLNFAANMFVG